MKHNRMALAGPLVLAALLTTTPGVARGAAPPGPSRRQPAPKSDDVRKALAALAEIERDLDSLRGGTSSSFRVAQKNIDSLKEQLAQLRKEIDALRKQQAAAPRIARAAPPPKTFGTIRLVNAHSEPVRIVVNGRGYRLASGQTRLLREQPPGPFTYEVVGVQGPVDRELRANETFTIRVGAR
jgi:hypothetical protein